MGVWITQKREHQEVQIILGWGHWGLSTTSSMAPLVELKQAS